VLIPLPAKPAAFQAAGRLVAPRGMVQPRLTASQQSLMWPRRLQNFGYQHRYESSL
jgi:hypothetical protein